MSSRDSIWSRGGSTAARGAPRGGWRGSSSATGSRGGRNDSIHAGGFRRATGEVGRKPGEMEMLLSPSRGVADDDEASLKNPAVQERFRRHIAEKLVKLDATWPERPNDATRTAKRKEELSIILLDFRKLREGLTSIRRVDAFAAEVYEASVRTSVSAESWQQLGACLPHLVLDLHPQLAASAATPPPLELSSSLASLSITSEIWTPSLSGRLYYISLYLLHLLCHHAPSALTSFHSTLGLFPDLPPPASSAPGSSHINLARAAYQALLSDNYVAYARLVDQNTVKRPPPNKPPPDALQLAILRSAMPAMREKAWSTLDKAYKMAGDFEDFTWLRRVLMYRSEEVEALRRYLELKGRKPPPQKVNSSW